MTWKESWTSSTSKAVLGFSFLAFLFLSANVFGQTDSIPQENKEDKWEPDTTHSAKKAVLLSAVLPGAGQIYNDSPRRRTWWKVPIIYAGLGALAYSAIDNGSQYRTWNDYYLERDQDATAHDDVSHPATSSRYTLENLETISSTYRRRRDLSFIGLAAVYTLQLIDASVDAHLFNFDTGNDLSFHWEPKLLLPSNTTARPVMGLRLSIKL